MNDQKIDLDGTEEEIITEFRDKWHKTYEVIEKALPKNVSNQEIEALIMFIFEYKSDKGPFSTKFNLRQWITDNSSSDTEGVKRVNAGIW